MPGLNAQVSRQDSTSHRLLLQGIHQVHIEAYDQALATFDTLMQHRPYHPIGYFGASAVYKTIMQNYRITTYEHHLDSLLELTVTVGEKAVRKNRKDVLAYFYMGGAYGFFLEYMLHSSRRGDDYGALRSILKGYRQWLALLFDTGKERGEIRGDIDSYEAAAAMAAWFDGAIFHWIVLPEDVSMQRMVEQYLDMTIKGLVPSDGKEVPR